MIYYVIFITGFAGFLLGALLFRCSTAKTKTKKNSKNCEGKKCRIDRAYGDFFEYDGSEKA
ncbi:MAG: hypothetical protein KBS52_03805 [Clostridiales bacterium]|nr:hypothetical protein [Candidatus Equinaster intestinalis]